MRIISRTFAFLDAVEGLVALVAGAAVCVGLGIWAFRAAAAAESVLPLAVLTGVALLVITSVVLDIFRRKLGSVTASLLFVWLAISLAITLLA